MDSIREPGEGNLSHGPLTVVIGAMWVVTVVGFALSLLGGPRDDRARGG